MTRTRWRECLVWTWLWRMLCHCWPGTHFNPDWVHSYLKLDWLPVCSNIVLSVYWSISEACCARRRCQLRAGTNDYTQQYLWETITCPWYWYLILVHILDIHLAGDHCLNFMLCEEGFDFLLVLIHKTLWCNRVKRQRKLCRHRSSSDALLLSVTVYPSLI